MTKIKSIFKSEVQNKRFKPNQYKVIDFKKIRFSGWVEPKLPVQKDYSYEHKDTIRALYLAHAIEQGVDLFKSENCVSNQKFSQFLLSDKCDHEKIEKQAQQEIDKNSRWR